MVNMAETESMFLGGGRLSSTMNGGADTLSEDSDLEAAPMLMPMYSENHHHHLHHHHHHHHQTKRNKRKNFQPRNISYCEESQVDGDESPTSAAAADDDYAALDLSSSEPKRPRTDSTDGGGGGGCSGDDDGDSAAAVPAPIDLSSKPTSTDKPDTEEDTADECGSSEDGDGSERSLTDSHRQFLLQQAFLHHHQQQAGPDASDLREYAQNTVKELLEIYGLNSAEVAESITNNVPIANFSSGKILESLRQGQQPPPQQSQHSLTSSSTSISATAASLVKHVTERRTSSPTEHQHHSSSASQPPTPPRSPPQSPISFKLFKDCWSTAGSTTVTNTITSSTTTTTSNDHHSSTAREEGAGGTTNGSGLSSKFPPRMVLPQNMATILALAAIQDRQSSNSCSPTVPSTSNPKDLSSSIALGREQGSPIVRDGKTIAPIDYSRYVRRFSGSLECGNQYCKELNYSREHFHCLDCNSRVFVKKEEMIRHFKWHKKRDESLQHGFMRYSPSDDCSERYPHCGHNRKQTHYHCIQGTCDKVYISTSDVQMHANYHRKDSAIIQEGFQRLRATEECRTPYCAFFGQRTTHFHCRRDHCQFTFKNKADMEKHKTYHIKDEQLARDGFKKFLKPDPCGFPNCRFSTMSNHIHCVRDGCSYVLHSSGQLLSHKRKHERKDSEIAYRKFKLAQQAVVNIGSSSDQAPHPDLPPGTSLLLQQASSLAALNALSENLHASQISGGRGSPKLSNSFQYKSEPGTPPSFLDQSTSSQQSLDCSDDEFTRYIAFYGASQICQPQCPFSNSDHYHCREIACELPFRCRETAEGHARMHDAQERVSDFFQDGNPQCPGSCPKEKHYHCTWEGCSDVVMPSERLEHFRSHEISAQHNNSLESLFRRKRGRPPKNRVIEVWNDYASGSSDSPLAVFTSFKLPKRSQTGTPSQLTENSSTPLTISPPVTITPVSEPPKTPSANLESLGFQPYNGPCPDPLCSLSIKPLHYHCSRLRCFFATDNEEFLVAHARDFHDNIDILDGFIFFDRSVDCRIESCPSNKLNRHFHCIKPGCGFSFVRYSQMAIHKAEHENESNAQQNSTSLQQQPTDLSESSDKSSSRAESPQIKSEYEDSIVNNSRPTVVKASGTFYPLCGLSNSNSSPTPPSDVQVKSESTTVGGGSGAQQPQDSNGSTTAQSSLPDWMSVVKHERFSVEAFSDIERLKPHVAKHSPSAVSPVGPKQESNNNEENSQSRQEVNILANALPPPPPLNLDQQDATSLMPPPWRRDFNAAMAAAVANQQLAMITSQGIPFMPHAMPGLYTSPTGLMFTGPPGFAHHHSALVNNGLLETARASMLCSDTTPESLLSRNSISSQRDMSQEAKKARVQSSMRMLKDEPVPEGYLRFRFNEDCRYQTCGYREHQTHFHCMRQDCGYSFCDKTRFVQHTARHERLDTLMGPDFRQFRSNMSCGHADCTYTPTIGSQNKSSHFHCVKCDYVCTDTNKVVAHRRLHQKLASIYDAGFEKFTPSQPCSAPDTCVHNGKQTHYHCLHCQYAVLGLSQMTAHKYRHE